MKNKNATISTLSKYSTPHESPGYLLWHVSTTWRNCIEDVLAPFDLTHPQFVVLITLAWLTEKKGIVKQVDISRAAGLDPNTTSQVLRLLEAKTYIARIRSQDERSKNPILTDYGADIISKALPAVEQADREFFASLSEQELSTLKNHFKTLLHISIPNE